METGSANLVVVGAGAAGLMASIFAGRESRAHGDPMRIVALDSARKLGAKILVAGGGRCNVTHHETPETAYAGGSRNTIRNVLRRWGVTQTVAFFAELGVELKREETGKLFPVTDSARTVLNALLGAARDAGVEISHPARVMSIEPAPDGYRIAGDWGEIHAQRVILATGGMALPRSGSDGHGLSIARTLGHTVTERVFPALVPLVLDGQSPIRALSGLTLPARLELRSSSGKRLVSFTNSTLCTHFGLSGPGVMDISRYYTDAKAMDPGAHLVICWLPDADRGSLEAELLDLGRRSVARWMESKLPQRMADTCMMIAGVGAQTTGSELRKEQRRGLLDAALEHRLPVTGDRGFTYAETTAGGVPLREVDPKTMTSRKRADLHLCGEILDVDGRIGGFNFQWAWASGHIAGVSAARALANI